MLNSNIRCIEMGVKGDTGAAGKELNSNIRCIEIKIYTTDVVIEEQVE